jgi:hypothetical protein
VLEHTALREHQRKNTMSRSYEPGIERSIFTDPLAEKAFQETIEANRPATPQRKPKSEAELEAETEAEERAEKERIAAEHAKREETLRHECEAAEPKEQAEKERWAGSAKAWRERFSAEAVEDRAQAERERNAQWIACPVCLGSFKKTAEGTLPSHKKRIPSTEVGYEWVECNPQELQALNLDLTPAVKL